MEPVQLAAILSGAVLLASMVSVQIGVSVALIELAFGIGLGNVFSLDPDQSWLVLIAGFASVVLTFLAGAEVDPDDFRQRRSRNAGSAQKLTPSVPTTPGPVNRRSPAGDSRSQSPRPRGRHDEPLRP
jgi:Kef-type K+ transport system membrane component KefB